MLLIDLVCEQLQILLSIKSVHFCVIHFVLLLITKTEVSLNLKRVLNQPKIFRFCLCIDYFENIFFIKKFSISLKVKNRRSFLYSYPRRSNERSL